MTTAIADRCEQDLQTIVEGLTLAGVDGIIAPVQNTYLQVLPDQLQLQFPAVLVAADRESITEDPSDFLNDWWTVPVRIEVVDANAPDPAMLNARRATYLLWVEQIAAKLRGLVAHPLLPTTPEAWNVTVKNLPTVDPRARAGQFYRTGLVASVHVTQVRTVT